MMLKQAINGIVSYLSAFQLISRLRLWKFVLAPAIISFFIAVSIGFSAWGLSDNIGNWLAGWWRWEWGAGLIASIGQWAGGLLVFILGLVLYKHLVMVLVSPFMSPLAERIEKHLTGIDTPYRGFQPGRAAKELMRGLYLALRNISRELVLVALLFLLSLIPMIGVIATILIFIIQAYYAGFGNMDYTMERHFSVKQSVQFVRRHKGLAIGNGVVFLALLMLGIGFLIAPPLATVAAALETVPRLHPAAPNSDPTSLV